jgi:2,3-bisphosphoglycerate-dependent phosphoglycerate mutase
MVWAFNKEKRITSQFARCELSTIYLVRHAHAEWTPDKNHPLSARGSEDAVRVANILYEYPIRAIFSSPARRACQTITPLAEWLGLSILMEPDLKERRLGDEVFENFFKAVEVTWQNPSFAHPGGESSVIAQKRGSTVLQRLLERHPTEHIVLSTHGNLMALILQIFDPSVDFLFWKSLTMPDIYKLSINQSGMGVMQRLWQTADI